MPKQTPETRLKAAATKFVREVGGYSIPIAAGPFSPPGLPDRIIFYRSHAYAVEFKSPTSKLGPKQEIVKRQIEATGCTYIVCRCLDDLAQGLGIKTLFGGNNDAA